MRLRYAHLSRWHYPQIFNTFVEAFADYAVSMNSLTRESLLSRWIKNAVDFKASVGAFDGERLVGFTMLGIDDCHQALADAGHAVNYTEVPEGHSASTWRNHLRGVLVSLFGDQNAASSVER